jgi:hypothetical protein
MGPYIKLKFDTTDYTDAGVEFVGDDVNNIH